MQNQIEPNLQEISHPNTTGEKYISRRSTRYSIFNSRLNFGETLPQNQDIANQSLVIPNQNNGISINNHQINGGDGGHLQLNLQENIIFAGNSENVSCKCRRSCRSIITHPLTLIILLIFVFIGVFFSTFFFQKEMAKIDNFKHQLIEPNPTHRHSLKISNKL